MNNEKDLLSHRESIDNIDAQILQLINKRAEHASEIGKLKGTGVIYRPEREAEVINRLRHLNQGPMPSESIVRLFREIMSECLALEKPLSVCCLGPLGTFTHLAALKHFGQASNIHFCTTIDEAFRMTETKQVDYLVAPVENSTEGSIGRTLDLLVPTTLSVCGEVILRIHHNLLSKQPEIKNINKVYAHPQALAQCHEWLNKNLPQAKRIPVSSNAQGAVLASQEENTAAIASDVAAEEYKLLKIAPNIEDESNNTTRFLVLGYNTPQATTKNKTSLIVSTPNKAGAIYQLLQPFDEHKVSMTKLESRPMRGNLWEYVFFIDIEGHQNDENVAAALEKLKKRASFFKISGSYPEAFL